MTISAGHEFPFSVRGRFHRSVDISSDFMDSTALDGYILTPMGESLIDRIHSGRLEKHGSRSWSLTGPYGTGKSSFGLFLSHLFAGTANDDPSIHRMRNKLGIEEDMLVIPVYGRRGDIAESLHEALVQAMLELGVKWRGPKSKDIGGAFEWALDNVSKSGKTGIMLIADEFGKFLEFAAEDSSADLFEMQILAELAQRSAGKFVVLNILHMAYTDYLGDLDKARRAEWQKVQGRFTDVPFKEPNEQFLNLISSAIQSNDEGNSFVKQMKVEVTNNLDSSAFDSIRDNSGMDIDSLLPKCVPIGPIAALMAWPIFRSSLAQNERSLFTFLTSDEPYAFLDGLRRRWDGSLLNSCYNLPLLYDYLEENFGISVFTGLNARRWSEIEFALSRIDAESPPFTAEVIKSLGLLSVFGTPAHLRASESTISIAVGDSKATQKSLKYLQKKNIIIYRKYEDSFAFWEGSDVDLESAFDDAKKEIPQLSTPSFIRKLIVDEQIDDLKPLVARRHYIETGYLRLFDTEIIDASELLDSKFDYKCAPNGNGRVIFALLDGNVDRKSILHSITEATEGKKRNVNRTIIVLCEPTTDASRFAFDYLVWDWLSRLMVDLQSDRIAREEVNSRKEECKRRFLNLIGPSVGIYGHQYNFSSQTWVYRGEILMISNSSEVQSNLSQICDAAYPKSPAFHNELVNKFKPSIPGTRACNKIIDRMLNNEQDDRLGIEKYPPEITIFESLLVNGGFFNSKSSRNSFVEPKGDWGPVWKGAIKFLKKNSASRKPLEDLYSHLESEPYGLKRGIMPVFTCLLHKVLRDDLAFYEDGLYTPIPDTEMFERLLRRPELFHIQLFQLPKECQLALELLHEALLNVKKDSPSLLDVVKPLVIFVAKLPPHVRKTKTLEPPSTILVRNAIMDTTDPYELTFTTLPKILGVSLDDETGVKIFVEKLDECVSSLRQAFPSLLTRIENEVKNEFRLTGDDEQIRKKLTKIGKNLSGLSADMTMNLLLREMSDMKDRDWRVVVSRIINKGIPPSDWIDVQVADFSVLLKVISLDLMRLQEVAAEKRKNSDDTIIRIGILRSQFSERREVIRFNKESKLKIDEYQAEFSAWLEQSIDEDDRLKRFAAIAEILHEEMTELGDSNE